MRKVSAYLILTLEGSSNSSKTAGLGEGESGMTAGTPSLQRKGTSNTNHAALIILDTAADGHDVYLSLYPGEAGLFSTGIFKGIISDGVFHETPPKKIYRIDNLDATLVQAYLKSLNAQIQRGMLVKALTEKLRDRSLSESNRTRYQRELENLLRGGRSIGYNAFNHNCTTVVVAALRRGGMAIPGWILETPSWLDRTVLKNPAHYHATSLSDFHTQMVGRIIERPHGAFPFEDMLRLGPEILRDYRMHEVQPVPPTAAAAAAAAAVSISRRAAPVLGAGTGMRPSRSASAGAGRPASSDAITMVTNPMLEAGRAPTVRATVVTSADDLLESCTRERIDLAAGSGAAASTGGAESKDCDDGKDDAEGEGTRPGAT